MLKYIIVFVLSLLFSLLLTPLVRSLAVRLGAFDLPDERKIHRKPIPRLGGLSIFIAFNLVLLIYGTCETAYEVVYSRAGRKRA